jgi:Tfp pilus assembly protein PilF
MRDVNRRIHNPIANLNRPTGFVSGVSRIFTVMVILCAISPAGSAGQSAPASGEESSTIEAHFSAAQQAQRDKDYAMAEREYRAVLALAPAFAEVHMNLGLVYQLEDRSTDAMAEFRSALKIKPELAGANFFLGVDYCKLREQRQFFLRAARRRNRTDRTPGCGWPRRRRSRGSGRQK